MFSLKNEYAIDNHQSIKQSYIYISNAIDDIFKNNSFNLLAFISSMPVKKEKIYICRNICRYMSNKRKSVLFINADITPDLKPQKDDTKNKDGYKEISCVNLDVKEFEQLVRESEQKNDIVIVNLPPVAVMADSLRYAVSCGNAVLLERYLYSKYMDYENTVLMLKQAGVNICGVVTYR